MRAVEQLFIDIKEKNPLVHQITNTVTINDCANVTLAIGASPVMAPSPEESADMVKMANSLVLNIGTITNESFEGMMKAGKMANKLGIPVIFDPVGVGATPYRREKTKILLNNVKMSIIRGNASEIDCLIGGEGISKGVDAVEAGLLNYQIAEKAAKMFNCVIVVSGQEDAVSNGEKTVVIRNGVPLLGKVTGTGCMSTAIIGSFAGITIDLFNAAVTGITTMGIAGEKAAQSLKETEGLGTFRVKLIDAISIIDWKTWDTEAKISEATFI